MNQPNDKGWVPERTFDELHDLAVNLQRRRSPVIRKMQDVQEQYEADVVVPTPQVQNEPDMPNLTPSLITDVVDGLAMRAASVMPSVYCPALDQYKDTGKRSVGWAKDRSRIIAATYHASHWKLGRRRALRHLNAYETHSIWVEPDFATGMPKIQVRNPLETYPEEQSLENNEPPKYVAYITRYSGDYLRARFPQIRAERGGPITERETHEQWDVFEWVDHDQITFGLLGPVRYEGFHVNEGYDLFSGPWMPLAPPMRNRAGVCLGVTPHAVTLHRIGNRLNALLENAKWQNKLMALDILAQEKAIFPDMYVLGDGAMQPRITGGHWQDGRSGEMNIVENGRAVGTLNQQPDARTADMISRLERNFRVSAGHDPSFGGEARGSSLRTGRALSQMAEFAVDPRIQEIHELDETYMPYVNTAIFEAYKGWWPKKQYSLYSGWETDKGMVEFTPEEKIESSANAVSYAIPGADIMQLTQTLGSLHGAELMSTETVQRVHPYIKDPHGENTTIIDEKLEKGAIEAMMMQAQSGQMPMAVLARIRQKMRKGTLDVFAATAEVDEEIRAEQAAAQEQAMQAAPPEANPAAQMGLAAGPGAAAAAAPPPGGPPPGEPNLPASEQMRQQMQQMMGA